MTDETSEPENVQSIRKANNVIADQLRQIATDIERGRVRGLWLCVVDDHRNPDLIAFTEKYSVAELLGVVELEVFKTKYSICLGEQGEEEDGG